EHAGKLVVSAGFYSSLERMMEFKGSEPESFGDRVFSKEARRIKQKVDGDEADINARLRRAYEKDGVSAFLTEGDPSLDYQQLVANTGLPGLIGSFVLFWWVTMLVCQGGGLDLDTQ